MGYHVTMRITLSRIFKKEIIEKTLSRIFKKETLEEPQWLPDSDLEALNKGKCPDCGHPEIISKSTGRPSVECGSCGSGFAVIPGLPPYMSVSHLGFNRKLRG